MVATAADAGVVEAVCFQQLAPGGPAKPRVAVVNIVPREVVWHDLADPAEAVPDLAEAAVRRLAARQADRRLEGLDNWEFVEQGRRLDRPIRIREQHVAIQPGDLADAGWEGCDRQVDQSLFQLHDVRGAHAQNIGRGRQRKLVVAEYAFNGQELEPGLMDRMSERVIVCTP